MRTSEIRERLELLCTFGLKELAQQSGVSERALWKLRAGVTKTAGESTKDKILGVLDRPKERKAKA